MAKKENFQEYVTRTQNEIAGIESKIEAEKLKKLQLEHKMQRLQNVTEYKVNKFFWQKGFSRIRFFVMRSQKWLLEEGNVQRQERQSFKVPSKT